MNKELLRTLGAVRDTQKDRCEFKKLNCGIDMMETSKGHYGIPLFDRLDKTPFDCHVAHELNEKQYDIKQLEQVDEQNSAFADQEQQLQESLVVPPEPHSEHHGKPGAGQGLPRGEGNGAPSSDSVDRVSCGKLEGPRPGAGQRRGQGRKPCEWTDGHDSRQVQPEEESKGHLKIYESDKSYITWVRTHATKNSAEGIMMLKVYTAHRDVAKTNRLAAEKIARQRPTKVESCRQPTSYWSSGPMMDHGTRRTKRDYDMETDSAGWEEVEYEPKEHVLRKWGRVTMKAMDR